MRLQTKGYENKKKKRETKTKLQKGNRKEKVEKVQPVASKRAFTGPRPHTSLTCVNEQKSTLVR